jgi:putative transposase
MVDPHSADWASLGLASCAGRRRHSAITTRQRRDRPSAPLTWSSWAAPTGPDQLWVADFSYVWTLSGFVYVAFVVDVFSLRNPRLAGVDVAARRPGPRA